MDAFLNRLAQYVLHKGDLSQGRWWFVFPSRRAGLYFRYYLSRLIDKPVWAPPVYTPAGFASQLSSLELPRHEVLVFRLLSAWMTEMGVSENPLGLYSWAETLLRDFNDIDMALADPKHVYAYISDLREIEDRFAYLEPEQLETIRKFWGAVLEPGETAGPRSRFMEIWKLIPEVYRRFREGLLSDGLAYEGLLFRDLVEQDLPALLKSKNCDKLVFAGFHSVSPAERRCFDRLRKEGKALFFWDSHPRFFKHDHQAGRFLSTLMQDFPAPLDFNSGGVDANLPHGVGGEASCIYLPDHISQALVLPDLIKNLGQIGEGPDELVIVLGDERLLLPVLRTLGDLPVSVNASMGFPFRESVLWQVIRLLFDLARQASGRGMKKDDLLAFLDFSHLWAEPGQARAVRLELSNQAGAWLSSVWLENHPSFSWLNHLGSKELPSILLDLIHQILEKNREEIQSVDTVFLKTLSEFAFETISTLNRLILSFSWLNPVGLREYENLVKEVLGRSRVPFRGEPLSGIQVMGFLETVALDFRKLIIVGMNEDQIPPGAGSNTQIPRSIRGIFQLALPEQDEARHAYIFYRLLMRPDQIRLLVNRGERKGQAVEESRFIRQVRFDPDLSGRFRHQSLPGTIGFSAIDPIRAEKDEWVLQKLSEFLENGKLYFSASALNTYLSCRLRFFLHYIAGWKPPEIRASEPDAREFGVVFHDCMRILYDPLKNSDLSALRKTDVLELRETIAQAVRQALMNYYPSCKDNASYKRLLTGSRWLMVEAMERWAFKLLSLDAAEAGLKILELEGPQDQVVQVSDRSGPTLSVRLGGVIDRVDVLRGRIRIVDYKTGPSKRAFRTLGELFDRGRKDRNAAAFQVIFYSWLWHRAHPGGAAPIQPMLLYTRELFREPFQAGLEWGEERVKTVLEDVTPLLPEFGERLTDLLQELFDPGQVFDQVADPQACRYCDFREICRR